MPHLRYARLSLGHRARQLPAATPARWIRPTPSKSDSPPFPGSTGRRGCVSGCAQEAGSPPSRSKCQDPSGTTLYLPPPTHARQLQARAHSRRQTPGLPRALSVLHHHNSNSTLSIKVSKLAQIPPPTHGPELQCAQGLCPRPPQRPRQRWRALGTAWQADADPGGPSRSPTNSDNPRVPGAPIWSRLTLALGGAALGPKECREEGRWLVG